MRGGAKRSSGGANAGKRHGGAGQLRIIGGAWRRQTLPIAAVEGLRPTPDRVRETLFNWLGQHCEGWRVLDLFSGTGALGFEAASRGATEVVMVEQNRAALQVLSANRDTLINRWSDQTTPVPKVKIVSQDALKYLEAAPVQTFDLVFLDPPFGTSLLEASIKRLRPCLSKEALLYVEWGEPLTHSSLFEGVWGEQSPELLRQVKAGKVHAHLFRVPAM